MPTLKQLKGPKELDKFCKEVALLAQAMEDDRMDDDKYSIKNMSDEEFEARTLLNHILIAACFGFAVMFFLAALIFA